MRQEIDLGQSIQTVQRPFLQENGKPKAIPPKPIERPQVVPPIRKPEVEKHHIKRDGKN